MSMINRNIQKTKRKTRLLPIIIVVLVILIGGFLLSITTGNSINNIIITQPPSYESGVEGSPVAGGRLLFNLSVKHVNNIEEVRLNFKMKNGEYKSVKLDLNNDKYEGKIQTEEGSTELEYFFEIKTNKNSLRYPEDNDLKETLVLADNATLLKNKFEQTITPFETEKPVLTLNMNDSFPITNVKLLYKVDTATEFTAVPIEYDNGYSVTLESAPTTSLEYYFVINSGGKDIEYPDNFKLVLRRDKKSDDIFADSLMKNVEDYAKREGENIRFTINDLKGTTTSYKGNEKVITLSVIKFWVMVETFNQLNQGKIDKSSGVARYGYVGTVQSGLNDMMINSNNAATGSLILKVGGVVPVDNTIYQYLGKNAVTKLVYTPGYTEPSPVKGTNEMTTDELALAMELLYNKKLVSESASTEMMALMEKCADYFSVKSIPGIRKIYMKTGYNPNEHFALGGIVATDKGDYGFGIFTEDPSGRSSTTIVKNVLAMIQAYYLAKY